MSNNPLPLRRSLALATLLLAGSVAHASTVHSGSNGSDGALLLTQPGTHFFDPRTIMADRVLDADNDGVYHFTNINIGQDVIVKLRANVMGSKPITWLASGDIRIEGTLDLNGEEGHNMHQLRTAATGGAGGYPGGVGSTDITPGSPGIGPGGGRVVMARHSISTSSYSNNNFGAGASHAATGGSNDIDKTYGNPYLIPLVGGSGGGGGNHGGHGGGGGGGGGAILLVSDTRIIVNGAITANGGRGGTTTSPNHTYGIGGGGSGGAIRLVAPTISGSGQLSVAGGQSGRTNGHLPGHPLASIGRIRLEAFNNQFTGTIPGTSLGGSTVSTPGVIRLPSDTPRLRVVSIGDHNVPAKTTGLFNPADMDLTLNQPVTINIEGNNVPLGSLVKLRITNQVTGIQELTTALVSGTLAKSTASVQAEIPHGYSTFTVEAQWEQD